MTMTHARGDVSSSSVLVVSLDETASSQTARMLRQAGYGVATAATFEQATDHLSRHTPDLLITDVRLGAFNGLHLAHRRHLFDPTSSSIVTHTEADAALGPEALRAGAAWLATTQVEEALLPLAATLLDRERPQTRPQRVAATRREAPEAARSELAPSPV